LNSLLVETIFEVMRMLNIFVNRSKYCNRSNRAILACVLSVSIISSGNCFAQSYWDAIFQLGYDPVTQKVNQTLACRRIEGIYRFRELISNNLTADQDLLIKIRDLDARITSLDVANVYDFVPYSDADGVWRAIGVRGQSDFNAYRLNEDKNSKRVSMNNSTLIEEKRYC